MTAPAPRPKRRHRRMVLVTVILAVGAAGLWLLVWTQVQRNARDAWVSVAERLEIDVMVAADAADSSYLGRIRSWLGIPRVHVFLLKDSDATRLLRVPAGEPYAMLIHLEGAISADAIGQVADRFPRAEVRRPTGGMGGGGLDNF